MFVPNARATARGFVERINAQDVSALERLMTDDHTFIDASGRAITGRETMIAEWREFFRRFPGYRITCETVIDGGDVIAMFGVASGGSRSGPASLQERWEVPAAWRAVVRAGRVSEWRVYGDTTWAAAVTAPS